MRQVPSPLSTRRPRQVEASGTTRPVIYDAVLPFCPRWPAHRQLEQWSCDVGRPSWAAHSCLEHRSFWLGRGSALRSSGCVVKEEAVLATSSQRPPCTPHQEKRYRLWVEVATAVFGILDDHRSRREREELERERAAMIEESYSSGRSNPLLAEVMQALAEGMRCPEDRRIELVIFLSEGETSRWCDSLKQGIFYGRLLTDIPWDEFLDEFINWFVSSSEKRILQENFLRLMQGNRSVVQYEIEFTQLAYYASNMVPNERERCFRFQLGLREDVRVHLISQRIHHYNELVETAKLIERDVESSQRRIEVQPKRFPEEQSKTFSGKSGGSK
ncbi:hypothetical protein KSP39_PZI010436 [Platanthera zijinensis]|uniref:Retrotransposon gag domain-containing protein n=1 Tax=Platanthera zijinensis TaxID=2320716 RepID=A0AAP0G644_9ASPA